MSTARKNRSKGENGVVSTLLTKKEGASRIAAGLRHLHSSVLGENNPYSKETVKAVNGSTIANYPWELTKAKTFQIASSAERYDLIARLVGDSQLKAKRVLRERLETVLEELLTNSLYHAYRSRTGEEKYARKEAVRLVAPLEVLTVKYGSNEQGLYLAVSDCGGTLAFEDISRALARCYGPDGGQIENKESGAGLGLYMVFDSATHLKIVTDPGKSTTISVWLSDKKTYDPDTFSFNYFGGRRD